MRRGQLFSMDALISIVLIIMILGTVSATSESLRSEITSMIGWYERANIPDNMLDVLTKSPGEPTDWDENLNSLKVPGLRGEHSSYIDYNKAKQFFSLLEDDNKTVEGFLKNLSMGREFQLDFYIGRWNFSVDFTWNPNASEELPPGTVAYDCSNFSQINQHSDTPSLIECPDLQIINQGIYSSCSVCVTGHVTISKTEETAPDTGVFLSGTCPLENSSFLAVNGDLSLSESAAAVKIDTGIGHIYVLGSVTLDSGSTTFYARNDIYLFGETGTRPIMNIGSSGSVSIGASHVFFKVHDTWYTVKTSIPPLDLTKKGNWYVWDKETGTFVSLEDSPDINITQNGFSLDIKIRGTWVLHIDNIYLVAWSSKNPPSLWAPPTLPYCFNLGPGGLPLTVSKITPRYLYPPDLNETQVWNRVVYMFDGSDWKFYVNPTISELNLTKARKMNSSWILQSSRTATINLREYSKVIIIPRKPTRIISGFLRYNVPSYTQFKIDVPEEEGYALFTIVDGDKIKVLGIWKKENSDVQAGLWEKSGDSVSLLKTYSGNQTSVRIPWRDIFTEFPEIYGKPVEMWVYKNEFNGPVIFVDEDNMGAMLSYKHEPAMIELWVWNGWGDNP